jgi:hypothetical protein
MSFILLWLWFGTVGPQAEALVIAFGHKDWKVREAASAAAAALGRPAVGVLLRHLGHRDPEVHLRVMGALLDITLDAPFDRGHPFMLKVLSEGVVFPAGIAAEVRPTLLGCIAAFRNQDPWIGRHQCRLPMRAVDGAPDWTAEDAVARHWMRMFDRVNQFHADYGLVADVSAATPFLLARLKERQAGPEPGELVYGIKFRPGVNEWLVVCLKNTAGRWRVSSAVSW